MVPFAMQTVLAIKPTLTVSEAREILNYVLNSESHIATLRQAGLPE